MKLIDLNSLPQEKPRQIDIDQLLEALPQDHTALQLGQVLYRCRSLGWRERWHIGRHILQFESPKLGVAVMVNEQSFAELLDRRLQHLQEIENGKVANGKPQQIEQEAQPQVDVRPQIEAPRAMSRTSDRRYRRL